MKLFISTLVFALVVLSIFAGCSSKSSSVIVPHNQDPILAEQNLVNQNESSNYALWGIWTLEFDLENNFVNIKQMLDVQMHMNITRMIPPPLIVIKSFNPTTHVVDVDVTLRNPYNITGYDVRAIIYSDNIGHKLLNPDGYTSLFDKPGGDNINPYRAYAKELSNREFGPYASFTENFLIYIPPGGGQITFAVEASWPGHCEEPYALEAFHQDPIYDIPNSHGNLQFEILDWQYDTDKVWLFAPEITGEQSTNLEFLDEFKWKLELTNKANAPAGNYVCLVKATSSGSGELAYYNYVTLKISPSEVPVRVGYPNGGENWFYTTSEIIRWSAVVSITDIKIELSTNSGISYDYVITESTPNDGEFEWRIPLHKITDNARIRISDAGNGEVYDESDNDFRIICPIPEVPQNVSASKAENTEWIRIKWSPVTYASGYNIYRNDILIVENIPDTSYYDYDVQLGTRYFYQVSAVNGCGESLRSSSQEGWLDSPITDWTILIYMHESNLGTYALQDINEMEVAGSSPGDLNILVLWDKTDTVDDVILYIIKDPNGMQGGIISPEIDDHGEVIPSGGLDMGNGTTLEKFLRWSMREYPAQHYGLVLWDHGDGPFSIIGDEGFIRSCCNGLQIWEIRNACQTVLNEHPETGRLDFIGFDACLMGWIEITYCLKNVCKATIGSEMLEPGSGWKYNTPLSYLRNNIATCTYQDLCAQIVSSYLATAGSGATLAAASTDMMASNVIPALDIFAQELSNIVPTRKNDIRNIRSTVGRWGAYCDEAHVRDIGYFATLTSTSSLPTSVKNAASQLAIQIENAMIIHGHNGAGSGCPYSESGWQIWFPSDYDSSSNSQRRADYQSLGFTATKWDDFLALYDNY